MGQIALTMPTLGQPDATEEPKIVTDLTLIQNVINGNLDTSNLAANAGITAGQLAAGVSEPAFTTYKDLLPERWTSAPGGIGIGGNIYPLGDQGLFASALPSGVVGRVFYLDPADWLAGSRTTKLRLRALMFTDAVAPGVTYTFGLYPVATFGNSGANLGATIATTSAVVSGSTAVFASPAANGGTRVDSTDFAAPAAGFYFIGLTISAASAANAYVILNARLQMRQV